MTLKEFDFNKEPIISVVKKTFNDAINMKATDIHFDPMPDGLSIRFRINGSLVEYANTPEQVKANIITRVKILSNVNITESFVPQQGTIIFESMGRKTNMRTSTLPVEYGEKVVVHISNYDTNIKSIAKIGFNKKDIEKIKEILKEPYGIILVTGANNSGKQTTLYSLLRELNSKSTNIISIENPVKLKIEGINQVEINPSKGLTYKSLLKDILSLDPNIIGISELIDDEEARMALRTALDGRLVISTMPTRNIYSTIDTLLHMDVENYLLGNNLNGIISERLAKKLCPNCRYKKKASDYEKKIIKYILGKDVDELYYPKGCPDCQNGYVGEIPVAEVCKVDDELRSAIANNKSRELIRKIIYTNNNSILKDALEKVIEGETSFDEFIRLVDIKNDFTDDEKLIKDFILGNNQSPFKEDYKEENNKDKETPIEEAKIKEDKEDKKTKEEKIKEDKKDSKVKDETSKEDKKETKKVNEKEILHKALESIAKNTKKETSTKENKEEAKKENDDEVDNALLIDDDLEDFNYNETYKII